MISKRLSQLNASRHSWRLSLRLLARDWRAGELTVLAMALMIAVTALTAVAFLTDRVGQAVELRAAESLAADLRLASARAITDDYTVLAAGHGVASARITTMPSVVFAGDANSLAAVRATTEGYPLRGKLKTADRLLQPPRIENDIPPPGEAWGSPRLLARLGVDTGTKITVGAKELILSRVLTFRPDEGFQFTDIAPSLLMNHADLEATGLVQPGSRVSYRMLFAADRTAIEEFKPLIQAQLGTGESIRDIQDTNPQIRSAMDRAGSFLNLASLVSVLLAAIAVAMAARRYAHRHRDRTALMKCLGASQKSVILSSMIQLLALALMGGILGSFAGFFAQHGLAFMMRDFIAQDLPLPGWHPALLGLMTAVFILAGFALPDLLQMGKTPPLRVLRHDIGPPPLRYGVAWLAAVGAVAGLVFWMVRDPLLVLTILAGTFVSFAVLGAAGWMLVRALQGFRGAAGVAWRYGLANIARRGRESVVQVVAFGLGLMVLLLLTTVRNDLMDTWQASLPENAPNQFIINIQRHEVAPLRDFLVSRGMEAPSLVPLVRARMTTINGQDVTQIKFEDPGAENWTRRDANLSWTDVLQQDNEVVEGTFWVPGESVREISLEAEFAADLGIGLGDELGFDVAGESVSATVTSFRTVVWDSFSPNFFMVFSPGVLDPYPTTWITSLYVQEDQKSVVLDLMRAFPSVTAIDLDAILGQVRDVMDKAALAVQAVFVFTLLAGLAVLWAAVDFTRDERRYESAMLRTLGATRKRMLTGVASEFLAIGLLSGLLAAIGATAAGYLLAEHAFELDYTFSPTLWIAGPLVGMIFVGISGMTATWRVISQTPVSVLRSA